MKQRQGESRTDGYLGGVCIAGGTLMTVLGGANAATGDVMGWLVGGLGMVMMLTGTVTLAEWSERREGEQ